ncbi:hypothetical protein V7149_01875 [Bacillus sp. JJ1503]|uniref:hypothetical protein n=1 Tax=Bacillus sp. JJ1503 TaxID=3122956 RepID=UPI002FFF85A8
MPTKTTNFNLIKPGQDDFYNVNDQNANMDTIDEVLKVLQDAINSGATEQELAQIRQDLATHLADKANPHGVTKTQVGLSNVDNLQQIPMTQKGAANGVATLGSDGILTASQRPPASVPFEAGNDVLVKHANAATASTTYTNVWSCKTNRPGVLRIKFTPNSQVGGVSAYGRIYVNGVARGTERVHTQGTGAVTYTEDITVNKGDTIQIYLRTTNGSYGAQTGEISVSHRGDIYDVIAL